MPEAFTFHSEDFIIRANEVDPTGNITLSTICQFFQEVAGNNAKDLNFDITDLQALNLTWVLYRMDIKINRYPTWREKITIETWPTQGDQVRAYRSYRIVSESGEELGCCMSYWMMINFETRRPVRIPKEVRETRLSDRPSVMELQTNRIKSPSNIKKETKIFVRKSDLDMNRHVNNASYVDWMLENLDENEISNISYFEIHYMHESLSGDVLISKLENSDENTRTFHLANQNEKTIALGKAILKPI